MIPDGPINGPNMLFRKKFISFGDATSGVSWVWVKVAGGDYWAKWFSFVIA